MFTKNIFNQKDGIADLVGNILEADYKNKMEELKGDQHKIDKNKNNKIDAHDFKILRGEKTMQKEAAATPHYTDDSGNQYHYGASGYVSVKNKSGIDQGQRHLNDMSAVHKKNYEKVHGMAWNQKNEEVELEEGSKHAARPRSASRPGTEPPVKGKLQDRMAAARERMDAKKKDVNVKEDVEQIDELNKDTVYSYNKKSISATGKLDKQLGSQIRSGNAPDANKTAHKLNKRLAGQERSDARLNKEEAEHNYTVKRTHSVKEPGELDSSTKRHHYDIHKDGKKVGELEHGEYFGDVSGKLHGKDLPPLGSYRGSHPESKLHSFLNSKTGTKWSSNLHKYQKEEAEQIDELSRGTVLSYTHKAGRSMGKHIGNAAAAKDIAKYSYDGETADQIKKKHIDKANKRAAGIDAASKRLAKENVEQVDERTLTKGETAEKERIVKGMKKSLAGFKSRYGDKAKSVMYATATARAKKD
jgi:conjugal transfer/entry exclusion protein